MSGNRSCTQTGSVPNDRSRAARYALATMIAGAAAVMPATAVGAASAAGKSPLRGSAGATSAAGKSALRSSGEAHPSNPFAAFTAEAPYRRGVVPTVAWERDHPGSESRSTSTVPSASQAPLVYLGGTDGVGVTTGRERVYLIFWGSQWGKQVTGSTGYATFAGDHSSVAPRLEAFFKGLGTAGDTWSGVMTQYCQGVARGTTSCPQGTYHVAYPTGGALSGVWEDTAAASPTTANAVEIATEAERGAAHFGNTTAASNRDAQYFVVSPTGTDPDGYKSNGFCAWHDFTGDVSLGISSPDGPLAFTNLPYLPDVGSGCGANFVNPGQAGLLDGVTIVAGHEYAETITDQFPMGGWTDANGQETGDKCAWIYPGHPGATQDIHLGTGSFAVQSTWANDGQLGGGCEISHRTVQNGDIISVNDPGDQATQPGRSASLQIHASDSANSQKLAYSATDLPLGLSINTSTGLVSGMPTAVGTYPVTIVAKDPTGSYGSTTFNWTIGTSSAKWRTVATPDPSTGYDELLSVSCPSTAFCTAVGLTSPSSAGVVPLIEQWDGHAWTASSSLTHTWGELDSISCPSASYCAAVGYIGGNTGGNNPTPLAAQWTHGQWAIEKVPVPTGSMSSSLSSVSCTSATSCVAIGSHEIAIGGQRTTLLLGARWNGTVWTLVPVPTPKNTLWASLAALSCSSAAACEAVGAAYLAGGAGGALAERWNGTTWTIQSLPGVSGAAVTDVSGVSCASNGDCLAVGNSLRTYGNVTPAYWVWHGTSWSAPISTPQPSGSVDAQLLQVSCYAAGSCTAVGDWTTPAHTNLTWATTWNGSHWLIERTPDPANAFSTEFYSISCTSATACAAAGVAADRTSGKTFVDQTF
jgi:serine protease